MPGAWISKRPDADLVVREMILRAEELTRVKYPEKSRAPQETELVRELQDLYDNPRVGGQWRR